MRSNGYTVVEVLAAMLILGIAFTGLVQGLRLIGAIQGRAISAVTNGRTKSTVEGAMARLLSQATADGAPPALSLTGNETQMSFACSNAPCRLWLDQERGGAALWTQVGTSAIRRVLPGVKAPAFRYMTDGGEVSAWPSAVSTGTALTAVALVDRDKDGSFPVAIARLWSQQPQDCIFDAVTAKCRPTP